MNELFSVLCGCIVAKGMLADDDRVAVVCSPKSAVMFSGIEVVCLVASTFTEEEFCNDDQSLFVKTVEEAIVF